MLCNARVPIRFVGHMVAGIIVCSIIGPLFLRNTVYVSVKIWYGRSKLARKEKTTKAKSKHTAEQVLLVANWKLFVLLVD